MKKLFSVIAVALVCAVMLVSCGGKTVYQDEIQAVQSQIESGDYTAASALADKIFAGKDKAVASEMITAFTFKAGEAALKLKAGDAAAAIEGYNKAMEILNYAKSMKDYAKTVEGLKALKVDVAAIEQNATTGLQGAQALVQQAEAEGEAEEGDAEEGEEE